MQHGKSAKAVSTTQWLRGGNPSAYYMASLFAETDRLLAEGDRLAAETKRLMEGGKPSTNSKSWLRGVFDSLLLGLRTGLYTLAIVLIRGLLFAVASAVVISVVVFSLSYILLR
jgi:hypothetical protein